jgi:hypothetical protein
MLFGGVIGLEYNSYGQNVSAKFIVLAKLNSNALPHCRKPRALWSSGSLAYDVFVSSPFLS